MPRGVRGPEAGPDLLQLAVAGGVVALTRRSTRPRFTLLLLVLAAVTIITIAYRGHADTGMPVVSGSGLVGRVVVASKSRSTVLLITDPTSNVGVRFGTAGNLAVAAGQGAGAPLRVDLVPPQVPVDKGELMITSGLQQSIYPPGVPIGTVLTTGVPRGSFQQAVTLAPVADLSRLQFVAVMQWAPKS